MAQIAEIQDFRGAGPPGDTGTFQMPCTVLVFQFTFSGTTYISAIRAGDRGWVLVSQGTDASTVIQAALNGLTVGRTWKETVLVKNDCVLTTKISMASYTRLVFEGRLTGPAADYAIEATALVRGDIAEFDIVHPNISGKYGIKINNAWRFNIVYPRISVSAAGVGIRIDSSNTFGIRGGGTISGTAINDGSVGIEFLGDSVNAGVIDLEDIYGIQTGILVGDNTAEHYAHSIHATFEYLTTAIKIVNGAVIDIHNCWFEEIIDAILIDNAGVYVPGGIDIRNNFFSLVGTSYNLRVTNFCSGLTATGNSWGAGDIKFTNVNCSDAAIDLIGSTGDFTDAGTRTRYISTYQAAFSTPFTCTALGDTYVAPGVVYINGAASTENRIDFSKFSPTMVRLVITAQGNEVGAGKGIGLWDTTAGVLIAEVIWNGNAIQYALAGTWTTYRPMTQRGLRLLIKASSGTENIVVYNAYVQFI